MSDSITLPNIEWGTNEQTANYIKSQVEEVEKLWKSMIEKAATIGKVFILVQQNSADGTFQTWIDSSFNTTLLSKATVYVYMKIAKHYELVKDAKSLRKALEMINEELEGDNAKAPKNDAKPESNEPEVIVTMRKAVEKLRVDEKVELLEQMSAVCEDMLGNVMLTYSDIKDIEDGKDELKGLKELKKVILSNMMKETIHNVKTFKFEFEGKEQTVVGLKNLKQVINNMIVFRTRQVDSALKAIAEQA